MPKSTGLGDRARKGSDNDDDNVVIGSAAVSLEANASNEPGDAPGDEPCAVHLPRSQSARNFIRHGEENDVNKMEERLLAVMERMLEEKTSSLASLQQVETLRRYLEKLSSFMSIDPVESLKSNVQDPSTEFFDMKQQITQLQTEVQELKNSACLGPSGRLTDVEVIPYETAGEVAVSLQQTQSSDAPQKHQSSLHSSGVEHDDGREWSESIWELGNFIGRPEIGFAGSCFTALILVVNACMQIMLCLIINDVFTQQNVDHGTISDMKRWRTLSGHDWNFVDSRSFEPLASRICNLDGSIPMSSSVASMLQDINEYLGVRDKKGDGPYFDYFLPAFGIGKLLCVFALIIWLLNLACAFQEAYTLAHGLLMLPTGDSDFDTDAEEWQVRRTMTHISTPRRIWCATLMTLQFFVLTCLGIFGTLYLVFTISLGDLLLNAAALQIVLDLDELFYKSLAPCHARKFYSSLEPLPRSVVRVYWGLDKGAVVALATVIIVIVTFSQTLLLSQLTDLQATREEICGGQTDIVTFVDKAGVYWGAHVEEVDFTDYENSADYRALRQLLTDPHQEVVKTWFGRFVPELSSGDNVSLSANVNALEGSHWSMRHVAGMSVDQSMNMWNPGCVDTVPMKNIADPREKHADKARLMILRDATKNNSISRCADIRKYCNYDSTAGKRARQWCPVTCGCDDPGALLVIGGAANGCPPTCHKRAYYKTAHAAQPCQDQPVGSLYFNQYLEGIGGLSDSYPPSWRTGLAVFKDELSKEGCAVARKPGGSKTGSWSNLCELSGYWFLESVAFGCPVSCRCNETLSPECPSQCAGSR